jgi:zinc/manganese transport system substrate-binding protein/manganese/iron transport system substrate-binding protein
MRGFFTILVVLLLAACGGNAGSPSGGPAGPGTLTVVTTSTVFADLVRNVGGARVTVTSLVPAGTDVHTYQAKPDDLRAVAGADVIVMNGLGLDDWLEETISAASADAPIVRLAVDLPGVSLLPGEEPETQNPHLWLDVSLARLYVARIGEALAAADATGAKAYEAGVAAYDARLADLDASVRTEIGSIPAADRGFVTFHDSLPYFARAYGLTIVGVAVDAPGQDPSAGEIAALIDAIRASGVKAIFSEDQFPSALVDQIGRETGATVEADLFTDSLGNDPIVSYEALIRWDVEQIVGALR